jgi:hypothetical protein
MAVQLPVPSSFVELTTFLAQRNVHDQVTWYRQLGLASNQCECADCGTLSDLDVPNSDVHGDKTRHSKCANPACRKKHNWRRTVFFKLNTIFNQHPQVAMSTTVLVLYCFVVRMSPRTASTVLGAAASPKTIRRLYWRFRMACGWWYRTHQLKRLGGEARTDSPNAGKAVQIDGKLRHVVEFDERRCVCVCVCVCVCACVCASDVCTQWLVIKLTSYC